MSEFTDKRELMTVTLVGCDVFPREAIVDGKEYKARSASVQNEIYRAMFLENVISTLKDMGKIEDSDLIEIGMTQDEIDDICYDTSIFDERHEQAQ